MRQCVTSHSRIKEDSHVRELYNWWVFPSLDNCMESASAPVQNMESKYPKLSQWYITDILFIESDLKPNFYAIHMTIKDKCFYQNITLLLFIKWLDFDRHSIYLLIVFQNKFTRQ